MSSNIHGHDGMTQVQVTKDLPEAMAVMGFAFYVAPMLLPLRAEMPPGTSHLGLL